MDRDNLPLPDLKLATEDIAEGGYDLRVVLEPPLFDDIQGVGNALLYRLTARTNGDPELHYREAWVVDVEGDDEVSWGAPYQFVGDTEKQAREFHTALVADGGYTPTAH